MDRRCKDFKGGWCELSMLSWHSEEDDDLESVHMDIALEDENSDETLDEYIASGMTIS